MRRFERAARVLEERVKEATAELAEKNQHLEAEIQQREEAEAELRSAQAQLVQSEKTAAIGQLTAGILHELNTPVGVLSANADLAGRCVSQLEQAVPENGDGSVARDSRYRRAFTLLRDSSKANASASQRIVRLLDNLKKFIRLDESPLAVTDIHEGIDSTLVLLGPSRLKG